MKKRYLLPVIFLASLPLLAQVGATGAKGATPAISVKPLTLITKLSASDQAYGMVVKGKVIYLFGNVTGVVSTDGYLQALDSTGLVQWSLALDSGQNEIATAATVDASGNIWVLGSTAPSTPGGTPSASPSATPVPTSTAPAATPTITPLPTPATPSATPTPTATSTSVASTLNPDSVQVDTPSPVRKDLTKIIFWKVSRTGVLLATYTWDMKRPVLIRSVILVKIGITNGIAFAGVLSTTTGTAGFYATSDLDGVISKPIIVGKTDTEINALMKMSSGSLGISGASSETLSGTKLTGIRDGIIFSIPFSGSSAGKASKVIRSSNTKSARSWQSATNSLFLGGDAVTSGKMEAVVTKFSSTFLPSWTTRYLSSSPAMTADGVTSHFALFSPTSLIPGVKGWKPGKGSSLTLAFSEKGALIGAYSLTGLPMSIGFSQDLGLVVLGRGTLGVSIFHTLTR